MNETADNVVELSESSPGRKTYKFWKGELDAAERRLRKFVERGDKVVQRYTDERKVGDSTSDFPDTKLNLFHTNVTTLRSMLYGNTPKIEVAREHADPDDDYARVGALIIQRALEANAAAPGQDLSTTLQSVLLDRLLPGLGIARVRYDYNGPEDERAPISYVHWKDFRWGWCRTWGDCPWVAFRVYLDEEAATERFGKKVAESLEYRKLSPSDDKSDNDKDLSSDKSKTEIWEIWCRKSKTVYWYAEGQTLMLDKIKDPLKLNGFFPCPRPLAANVTTNLYLPVADFVVAQDLYNQVDELATRISIITRAIKVIGVYDSGEKSVARMFDEGVENDLIPVDNWAMFAEKGGLQGTIDWFPVQDVVAVLQTLRQVLDSTIDALYQVTGMSDVLRGANTQQYTAADTEQLKAKFGSIRVQALQDDFARFAAELADLKAQVMCKHFSDKNLLRASNAQFLAEPDLRLVPGALNLLHSPAFPWRINIKPESLAMVDYAQLRAERTEFLNALATYIQSAQAMIQAEPGAGPFLLQMLKWGMAGFKGAKELEGIMDQAIQKVEEALQKPQQDEGAAERQAEQQRIQMEHNNEMQKISAKTQADITVIREKQKMAMEQEMADHRNKLEQELTEHKNAMQKMREEFIADMRLVKENFEADLGVERAQAAYSMEERDQDHAYNMEELRADHAKNMREKQYDATVAARSKNSKTDTD
jgi:hypothetical protein